MFGQKYASCDYPSVARVAGLGLGLLLLALLFMLAPIAWADSIDVTTEQDILDANGGNCVGLTPLHLPGPDGLNSLREAVCAANTNPGPDTIRLGDGAFRLFRLGEDDTGQDGDLDILAPGGNLSIQGTGPDTSVISNLGCVAHADRVFQVDPTGTGGITVSFIGLTMRKGCTTDGGGIRLDGDNTVNLTDCIVAENQVVGDYSIGAGILQLLGTLNLSATQVLTNSGSGSYVGSQSIGGGIFSAPDTTLYLDQSTVAANQVSAQNLSAGAGIYANGSQVTIQDSDITGNKVNGNDARGGAIAARLGTTLTISDCFVAYNEAEGVGGGIYNDGGSFRISGSLIGPNTADEAGGGFYASGGTIECTDSMLLGNTTDGEGGGALNDNGTLDLSYTLIYLNQAGRHGGGIWNKHTGTLTVTNSTFLMNSSALSGGGVGTDRGAVAITNCTFSQNKANESGGGLYHHWVESSDLNFTTFYQNVADENGDGTGDGGGIYVVFDTLNLNNSIVAGNTDRSGEAPDCGGEIVTHGDNIIQDDDGCILGGSGTNTTGVDPKLGVLATNGGPDHLPTHALLEGSPALDAVTTCNDVGGSPVTIDERGVSRPTFSACDIGAFEWGGHAVYLPIVLRE